MTRKEALEALLVKVEAGVEYETMGHTQMCQRAFPKPNDFDGSRESYAKSDAQMAILAWRNGSLDAAKSLHDAVLPGWGYSYYSDDGHFLIGHPTDVKVYEETHHKCQSRAWLIAIIKALIAECDAAP